MPTLTEQIHALDDTTATRLLRASRVPIAPQSRVWR